MSVRESDIAISHALRWKLARIVAATQTNGQWDEKKNSVEQLAETILGGWISANYPELTALWAERESINDRAHQAVNERNQK